MLFVPLIARAEFPEAWVADLETTIYGCVTRDDNANLIVPGVPYPVFKGCWDWHSAVHGHWALLRVARARGSDTDATRWVERSLSPVNIAREAQLLASDAEFENPYGRSWFLRLAVEFERWATSRGVKSAQRLRSTADTVAASLLERLRRNPPRPSSVEYENASWALVQLHAYFSHVADPIRRAAVERLIDAGFLGGYPEIGFAEDRDDFFSRFGNWAYLLAEARPEALPRLLAEHPTSDEALRVPEVTTAHSMGLVWSRAWAFRAIHDRATDPAERERWQRAFAAHAARGMENHGIYKNDYKQYGHWVSQFAVYALTQRIGTR